VVLHDYALYKSTFTYLLTLLQVAGVAERCLVQTFLNKSPN